MASPPRSSIDDIIDVYRQSIDFTLVRENLKKTPEERVRALQELQRAAEELQRAGRKARGEGG
jgi:hypothetical protein